LVSLACAILFVGAIQISKSNASTKFFTPFALTEFSVVSVKLFLHADDGWNGKNERPNKTGKGGIELHRHSAQ
jgi:hypothetical protein